MKICASCSELYPDDAQFCPECGAELKKNTDKFLGRTIAARYRLIRRLGAGGMSVVYLARHVIIERLSAIKILRQDLGLNPAHRERFLREARAVNRINHRNIVEITDVGEADGVAYLVMEYVQGESLLAALQPGAMPWPRGVKIAIQVASALARAHQMNVIHRDLKPENIMLVPEFREDAVKLMDFGIAKMVDLPALTFSEQLFGTPGYIAPEYVEGNPIDARCDVYSLGVVLYEMVTGHLPFDGRGQADLLLKPLTHPPIPPGKRVTGLPPDLETLILRMLARRPDDRPHDAFAVHDALIDILRRFGSAVPAGFASEGSIAAGRPVTAAPAPPPAPSTAPSPVSDTPPGPETPQTPRVLTPRNTTPHGREPLDTMVDEVTRVAVVQSGQKTANVAKLETSELASRWAGALTELEQVIAKARRRGGRHTAAAEAAEIIAESAREMIPRIERASRVVSDNQARVDRLEAEGREFRQNLGHAIDVLVHDRSRERAHLEAMMGRHSLIDASPPSDGNVDARAWERAALAEEEGRTRTVVEDLSFQIVELQAQLDKRNEQHDRIMVAAAGALEGSLAALRHLQGELVRTIDDGIRIVTMDRKG